MSSGAQDYSWLSLAFCFGECYGGHIYLLLRALVNPRLPSIMTTGGITSAFLVTWYPEQNPFLLNPPLYNLTPGPDAPTRPDNKRFALASAQSTGINPLCMSYGPNPLFMAGHLDTLRLPFAEYRRPPPIKEAQLSDDMVFLEQICRHTTDTALFTIRVGKDIRLLKVVSSKHTTAAMIYRS